MGQKRCRIAKSINQPISLSPPPPPPFPKEGREGGEPFNSPFSDQPTFFEYPLIVNFEKHIFGDAYNNIYLLKRIVDFSSF